MAARESSIWVTGKDGEPFCITPDADIPNWAVDQLDSRHFENASGADGPPPKSGKGSGVQAWAEYAATNRVEVAEDATRDDVIAALDAAGIPTE
jgi:hypothetical protein